MNKIIQLSLIFLAIAFVVFFGLGTGAWMSSLMWLCYYWIVSREE